MHHTASLLLRWPALVLSSLALLSACGGGSSSGDSYSGSVLPASSTLANICTPNGEKSFLRSFVDETYLWYNEVPAVNPNAFSTPQAYFDVLKTFALTPSGRAKDQFHWSQTTASWNASANGIAEEYGIQWASQRSSPPRNWVVADVMPNSPAATAGVRRGDVLQSVDALNFVTENSSAGIDALNEGLFPTAIAEHTLGFSRNSAPLSFALTPATVTTLTVQNVKVISTPQGNVGYFTFDTHIAKSEAELIAAINTLKTANVNHLVLDLRYNGGGLLSIASKLAYMIAGPTQTQGKVFERLAFNAKLSTNNYDFVFASTNSSGQPLPTLNLSAVTIIATHGTASASESIINSLRGIDVKVNLIGDTTRGKPYGFVPEDNCGYTYFAIQFKGVNQKGFGDYADGFAPTCLAADDFSHLRGDPLEASLATALSYIDTGSCPASALAGVQLRAADRYELVRPASQEMRILDNKPAAFKGKS